MKPCIWLPFCFLWLLLMLPAMAGAQPAKASNSPRSVIIPPVTYQKTLRLRVHVTDPSGKGLDHINVWDNNVPVFGMHGYPLKGHPKEWTGTLPPFELVTGHTGQNKMEISVTNTAGLESLRETRYTVCRAKKVVPTLYVVAIGVAKYKNPRYSLRYAGKDAQEVQKSLLDAAKDYGALPCQNPPLLLNENATANKILGVKTQLAQSKPDDIVIFFFSGHGVLDKKFDFYFGTYDIDFAAPKEHGLSYEKLLDLLDSIPARNRLLLIDACHAGEVDKEALNGKGKQTPVPPGNKDTEKVDPKPKKENPADGQLIAKGIDLEPGEQGKLGLNNSFALMQQLFADLNRSVGAYVISAASGLDLAYEGKLKDGTDIKNGTFTRAILEVMDNPKLVDPEGKEGVTVHKLQAYILNRVVILSEGMQVPTSREENMEYDFRIR